MALPQEKNLESTYTLNPRFQGIFSETNKLPAKDDFMGIISCNGQDYFCFEPDDYFKINLGEEYVGEICLLRIPRFTQNGFYNEKGILQFSENAIEEDYFGLSVVNLQSVETYQKDPYRIDHPLIGYGSHGCAKLLWYGDHQQKVFRFRHHFLIPILLSNNTLCYFAFEQAYKLKAWLKAIRRFPKRKKKQKRNGVEIQLQVAVRSEVYYDNLFGCHITKDAVLEEIEINSIQLDKFPLKA